MQNKLLRTHSRPGAAVSGHDDQMPREPNFYLIPFASQMIVWAMRKRLHAMAGGPPLEDDVIQVFHLASWTQVYSSLLTATQIFVTHARSKPLRLHAVACPTIECYESWWLNALTHLQDGQRPDAILSLCEIMRPTGTRLALPHLMEIVEQLGRHNLRFAYVRVADSGCGRSHCIHRSSAAPLRIH